jgi:hypothetical protein
MSKSYGEEMPLNAYVDNKGGNASVAFAWNYFILFEVGAFRIQNLQRTHVEAVYIPVRITRKRYQNLNFGRWRSSELRYYRAQWREPRSGGGGASGGAQASDKQVTNRKRPCFSVNSSSWLQSRSAFFWLSRLVESCKRSATCKWSLWRWLSSGVLRRVVW